jgi:hypothetical protein
MIDWEKAIAELFIGKDSEGSDRELIEVSHRHLNSGMRTPRSASVRLAGGPVEI